MKGFATLSHNSVLFFLLLGFNEFIKSTLKPAVWILVRYIVSLSCTTVGIPV